MSTENDDELMNNEDARVPEAIRAHGSRFRKPARFVVDFGNDEYILIDADGEVLDLVFLSQGARVKVSKNKELKSGLA
jgi:hypothetical protein